MLCNRLSTEHHPTTNETIDISNYTLHSTATVKCNSLASVVTATDDVCVEMYFKAQDIATGVLLSYITGN